MIFSLDTSRPFSAAQTLDWTAESGATPLKKILFEEPIKQYIYESITESLSKHVTDTVAKIEFDENTYFEVTTDYQGFLNSILSDLIPSFHFLRQSLSIELQEIEESEAKANLDQFNSIVDLITLSKSSYEFNEYYYYLLIEFYDYSTKHLKRFSSEFISSLILAGEIKKKVLERLENQDK